MLGLGRPIPPATRPAPDLRGKLQNSSTQKPSHTFYTKPLTRTYCRFPTSTHRPLRNTPASCYTPNMSKVGPGASAIGLETVKEAGGPEPVRGVAPALGPEAFYAPPSALLTFKVVGLIEACHLADLQIAKPVLPLVSALQARYHEIARLLAAGLRPIEISRRLGTSLETLELLFEAPAFKMVLSKHQEARDQAFTDLRRQMNLVTEDALALLHLRIIEGKIGNRELVSSVMQLLDKEGYGAVQKHLFLSAPADEIQRAKRASLEANRDRVLRVSHSPPSVDGRIDFKPLEKDEAA